MSEGRRKAPKEQRRGEERRTARVNLGAGGGLRSLDPSQGRERVLGPAELLVDLLATSSPSCTALTGRLCPVVWRADGSEVPLVVIVAGTDVVDLGGVSATSGRVVQDEGAAVLVAAQNALADSSPVGRETVASRGCLPRRHGVTPPLRLLPAL